jgi:hypothetical protein
MKKILLFLSIALLVSCSEVGYIATVEVDHEGVIDTIRVPYDKSQGNTNTVFAPDFELKNGVLSESMTTILTDVRSFSVIDIERLENK